MLQRLPLRQAAHGEEEGAVEPLLGDAGQPEQAVQESAGVLLHKSSSFVDGPPPPSPRVHVHVGVGVAVVDGVVVVVCVGGRGRVHGGEGVGEAGAVDVDDVGVVDGGAVVDKVADEEAECEPAQQEHGHRGSQQPATESVAPSPDHNHLKKWYIESSGVAWLVNYIRVCVCTGGTD